MVVDIAEKLYLAGFPLLLLFMHFFPLWANRHTTNTGDPSAMEFLPLMATSVYCAIGLVWGYLRLIYVYLYEDISYQGQLSEIN